MQNLDDSTYDVFGFRVKFKPDEDSGRVSAEQVIDYVRKEGNSLLDRVPNLNRDQLAVLLSLKFASEKLNLEDEYRENIEKFQSTANDILHYIDEVVPQERA